MPQTFVARPSATLCAACPRADEKRLAGSSTTFIALQRAMLDVSGWEGRSRLMSACTSV
jgi:hypothetical protein